MSHNLWKADPVDPWKASTAKVLESVSTQAATQTDAARGWPFPVVVGTIPSRKEQWVAEMKAETERMNNAK